MAFPSSPSAAAAALAVAETRAWVERAVIGLGLCPFARGAQVRGRVRYACSRASGPEALLENLGTEVEHLLVTPAAEVETTLLVHPWALGRFTDYNDFLDVAEAAVQALGGHGILQVASFHPRYRFAGLPAGDVTHMTNRAPHPVLQLLREASVSTGVDAWGDTDSIVEANLATARRLGRSGWLALHAACRADAHRALASDAGCADSWSGSSVANASSGRPEVSAVPAAVPLRPPDPRSAPQPAPEPPSASVPLPPRRRPAPR